MALKSIYEIEIDDKNFRKFKEMFDKYQAELKKLPDQWNTVNQGIKEAGDEVGGLGIKMGGMSGASQKYEASSKTVNAVARSTAVVWSAITNSVRSVDIYLSHATGSLVKWSTLTAAFSGLLGAGSLFGIDRLAASVSQQRRSSMQLGVSYGQQASFNTNYNRLIDPQSLLSNAATAKYDMSSPQYTGLLSAGISPEAIKRGNAASISSDLLARLPELFKGTQKGLIGAKAHAYGIDQLMSMQDIVAFLNASDEERRRIVARNAEDARNMDLSEQAQRKWQDLTTQLGRAGYRIESVFAEKLSAIEPGLEKVSDAFIKIVKAFAGTDLLKGWVNTLGDELEIFADYIKKPEFTDDVKSFAEGIGSAAEALWAFIRSFSSSLGKYAPSIPGGAGANIPETMPGGSGTASPGGGSTGGGNGAPPALHQSPYSYVLPDRPRSPQEAIDAAGRVNKYPNNAAGHTAFIRDYMIRHGRDPNFALAVGHGEGGLTDVSNGSRNFVGEGSPSVVDRNPDGTSSSWGDFQLYDRGFGALAMAHGINTHDPNQWQAADAFSMDQMMKDTSPWHGDAGMAAWGNPAQAPKLIIRNNTGSNPVTAHALTSDPYTAVSP